MACCDAAAFHLESIPKKFAFFLQVILRCVFMRRRCFGRNIIPVETTAHEEELIMMGSANVVELTRDIAFEVRTGKS